MCYKGALDFSCREAAFAVAGSDGNVIIEENFCFPARDATRLPALMRGVLAKHGLDFNDISEWSVGAGPGSFTGLRIASAFVMGLAFGRENVRRRAVSTTGAIAKSAGADAAKVLVVYDGRKNELFAYGLVRESSYYINDGFSCVIRNASDAEKAASGYAQIAAYAADADAAANVAGEAFAGRILRAEHIAASNLIFAEPENFTRPLTDLVYLRPAVFVEPLKPRTFD